MQSKLAQKPINKHHNNLDLRKGDITWSRPTGCMFTSLSALYTFLVSCNYTTTAIFTAHLRQYTVITSSNLISDKNTVGVCSYRFLKHCHQFTKALQWTFHSVDRITQACRRTGTLLLHSCASRLGATTWRTLVDVGCRGGARKPRTIDSLIGHRPPKDRPHTGCNNNNLIQVPTVSRDSAVIVDKSKFGVINARSTVASVTASRYVPHDTSFENVSIPSAVTTILPALETSAVVATQIPLADDDTVNESCKFGGDLPSGLRFVQWNARSVYAKIDDLRLIMGNSKREAEVLGITETWLNTTCRDSSVATSTTVCRTIDDTI